MSNRIVLENFDLHIGPGESGVYSVTVLSSPAGESLHPVPVPMAYDDEPMRRWMQHLRNGRIERDDLIAFGRRLSGYLFAPGSIRDLYQRSLGMVDARGARLRLRLRILAPELSALPWEYAYEQEADDFLVLSPRTVLVRYHSQPVPPYSIASRLPVTVLVLVASPPGAYALDVFTEILNLLEALRPLLNDGRARLDLLVSMAPEERPKIEVLVAGRAGVRLLPGPASVDALRNALRHSVRVLHYIGHGRFDDQAGGSLLLANDRGSYSLVGAQTLSRELGGAGTALVVLNACRSATESTARSYMGLAPRLIRAGVPAVVAMQYAIMDRSAMAFSQALYSALADDWPLDAAVTEGRKALSARVTPEYADWGIPVLFMRSSDGVLWREEPPSVPSSEAQPDQSQEGGITFHGTVTVHGDVVGRDKIVHGDEERGEKP